MSFTSNSLTAVGLACLANPNRHESPRYPKEDTTYPQVQVYSVTIGSPNLSPRLIRTPSSFSLVPQDEFGHAPSQTEPILLLMALIFAKSLLIYLNLLPY